MRVLLILIFTLLLSLVYCRCPPGTTLVCADPVECLPFAQASLSVSDPAPDQVKIDIVGEEGMDFEILILPQKSSTKYASIISQSRILGLNVQTSPDLIVSGRNLAKAGNSITLIFDVVSTDIILFQLSILNHVDYTPGNNEAEVGVRKNLGFELCPVNIGFDIVNKYEVINKGSPCFSGSPRTLSARPGVGQNFDIVDYDNERLGDVFGNLDCIDWNPSAYFSPFVFENDPITDNYIFSLETETEYASSGMENLFMFELISAGKLGPNTINEQCLEPTLRENGRFEFLGTELGKTYMLLAANPARFWSAILRVD